MRIGIVARPDLPEAVKLVRKALRLLSKVDVKLAPEIAIKLGKRGVPIADMAVDAIVTIGGDGTVLVAQQQAPAIPVLGINMGGTGFLADVSPSDAPKALRGLLAGKLPIEERMRLATEVAGKRLPDALNEAVVRAASPSRMLMFQILVNGKIAERTRGDGVILTTPTGSTAYALAAGGPIIDPNLEVFAIVPICTSRPRAAPLVVSAGSRIEVELLRPDRKALVAIDGQFTLEVDPSEKLLFYRSDKPAKFFKFGGEFYQKVREKL
jgi:NAD+ kinase